MSDQYLCFIHISFIVICNQNDIDKFEGDNFKESAYELGEKLLAEIAWELDDLVLDKFPTRKNKKGVYKYYFSISGNQPFHEDEIYIVALELSDESLDKIRNYVETQLAISIPDYQVINLQVEDGECMKMGEI